MSPRVPGMMLHIDRISVVYEDPTLSRVSMVVVHFCFVLVLSSGLKPPPNCALPARAGDWTLACVLLPSGDHGWLLEDRAAA